MVRMRGRIAILLLAACGGGSSSPDAPTGAPDAIADGAIDGPGDAPVDTALDGPPPVLGAPPTGMCDHGWCWVLPRPQGVPYAAAWGATANDVWAVTTEGTMLHFDGTAWMRHGAYNQFGAVAGLTTVTTYPAMMVGRSASDVWLANGAVAHWDGTDWTSGRGSWPLGFAGPTTVWTVGSANTHEWTGTQWVDHPLPSGSLPTIAIGGSGSTAIAVSRAGGLQRWNGTAWTVIDSGSHPGNAATVIDATHVVVAQNNNVAFWTNGTWTQQPPPVSAAWDQIVARSPTDVWIAASGSLGQYRYHWNGTSWTDANDPGRVSPGSLSVSPVGDLYSASSRLRRYDGTTWSTLLDGYNGGAVAGTSATDIWLLTAGRTNAARLQHWNGLTWNDVNVGFAPSDRLSDIWANGPNDVWIVGASPGGVNQTVRRMYHWDGATWVSTTAGTEPALPGWGLVEIWGDFARSEYAVLHRTATGWQTVTEIGSAAKKALFGSSATNVFVVTASDLWRWDGSAWTSTPAPRIFARGWTNSPTDVWLSGSNPSELWHYDGTQFSQVATPDTDAPIGTAAEMYTFGATTMTKWSGGVTGTRVQTPRVGCAADAWLAPDGHLWQACNGLLVH